jgi:hypothetical protein
MCWTSVSKAASIVRQIRSGPLYLGITGVPIWSIHGDRDLRNSSSVWHEAVRLTDGSLARVEWRMSQNCPGAVQRTKTDLTVSSYVFETMKGI